jgi:hypothetical protein
VTAERSDAKFSLLNGGVGSVGFLQIGVSSYDEGSTAKLMAIGNVKPMQSDMEAGNASDRAPLGSQPPIFVRRHDANRSGVVHYDLDPPHFAGNADAHQDAPEGAPCEEGETAEQCIQWDYVAHLYTSQQTRQPIPSLMEPLGSVIGASSASRCSTSADWRWGQSA